MPEPDAELMFGKLAIHYKLASREQVLAALETRRDEGGARTVAAILHAQGVLTPEQVAKLRQIQQRSANGPAGGGAPAPSASATSTPAAPAPGSRVSFTSPHAQPGAPARTKTSVHSGSTGHAKRPFASEVAPSRSFRR